MEAELNLKAAVGGYYRMTAIRPDGTERVLAEWFENLITDNGMNHIGLGGYSVVNAYVGSGNTEPAVTDSGMASTVAVTANQIANSEGYQSFTPFFTWRRRRFRFVPGTATGTLREVGVGNSADGVLFSRALIKNHVGTPISVVVLADEAVDVEYELRMYPPLTDTTFDIDISGATHSCILRAGGVTGSWSLAQQFFAAAQGGSGQAHAGNISLVTELPSGAASGLGNLTFATYVSGSFELGFTLVADLAEGNIVTGIRSLWITTSFAGAYQIQFDPVILKTSDDILTFNGKLSWARYTP